MATLKKHQQAKQSLRVRRYFSEDFKRKKVREIEQNLVSVRQVAREYQVSTTAIYKWIYKYSAHLKKGVKQVVEFKSDTMKITKLREELRGMEQAIGQKQIRIDFLEEVIALAEKEYGIDIKKKFSSTPLSSFGQTGKRAKSK